MIDRNVSVFVLFAIWSVHRCTAYAHNLDLISGDLKRLPLTVSKESRVLPVLNKTHQKSPKVPAIMPPPLQIPKLPTKPPPSLTNSMDKTTKVLLESLTRKKRLAPLIPPIFPPLPLLPLPILPLLPPPILPLPFIPNLLNPLKPLRVPILGKKTSLAKTLKSIEKLKPVKLPDISLKKNILEKLLDLKKRGSLTTAEFIRFKKLLLR